MIVLTIVISANLQGLISSHDQSDLVGSLVLQQSDIPSSAFLPFLVFFVESEKFSTPGGWGERERSQLIGKGRSDGFGVRIRMSKEMTKERKR